MSASFFVPLVGITLMVLGLAGAVIVRARSAPVEERVDGLELAVA